jgi:CheY-like chemotaxis protein
VLLNLAVNARDAMPQGGKLKIETRNVTVDESTSSEHPSVVPGSYVMLIISDTGSGMDAHTMTHAFEPFFTTKEKGTGLGLSTVYGITKQSDGYVLLDSEPGRGASFRIYLPRVDEHAVDNEAAGTERDTPRGSESILVVEDEEMLRKLACHVLRSQGYSILEAANAGEALLLCEKYPEPIPLMITDVVMPQMSGPELAARLRSLRPEMRVLYMSGYTDDSVVRHGLADPTMAFIQKPFSPAVLARTVRAVLDQKPQPSPPT